MDIRDSYRSDSKEFAKLVYAKLRKEQQALQHEIVVAKQHKAQLIIHIRDLEYRLQQIEGKIDAHGSGGTTDSNADAAAQIKYGTIRFEQQALRERFERMNTGASDTRGSKPLPSRIPKLRR